MSEKHTMFSVPVVCFIGVSGSGKTTFLEGVIRELAEHGWRVGTAKHHHLPDFEIDIPGKDSWRHAQAGAVVSMISSEGKLGVVRKVDRERTLEEMIRVADGAIDILLTESIRNPAAAQIEIVRTAHSDSVTCVPEDLFALVTDGAHDVGDVPVFALDDVQGVVDLIEGTLLAGSLTEEPVASAADDKEHGGPKGA
ncbi:MAG: molybdopterin-guanine dinucleotide biosynthesis protein B [Coriobacteriia bacterium]|nr:molybdopterin-guanine dinucleotide biosynthesis protein B [Coriobacteriia bacterium]